MGAFTNYATYKAAFESSQPLQLRGASGYNNVMLADSWSDSSYGTAPTTAVSLNKDSVSVAAPPGLPGTLTKQFWLSGAQTASEGANSQPTFFIVDMLSIQGGLNGTVATAQTTNLPTAALPRYTDGAGVCIGIRVHTSVGSTATTLTCSYTNQAGTSGQTTPAVSFGGANKGQAGIFIVLPLADGDTGVRSVQSVTLAATTGTAGAFGVSLFKPLFMIPGTHGIAGLSNILESWMAGKMIDVHPDACLRYVTKWSYQNGSNCSLRLVEA